MVTNDDHHTMRNTGEDVSDEEMKGFCVDKDDLGCYLGVAKCLFGEPSYTYGPVTEGGDACRYFS